MSIPNSVFSLKMLYRKNIVVLEKFDYEELLNTEFVGFKRPTILHDELSLKHEEIRKASESRLPDLAPDLNQYPNNYDVLSDEERSETLFLDIQKGNIFNL